MQSSKMNEIIYKRLDGKIFHHLVVYFRGEPSITFFNQETKIFITAYKLAERSVDEYLTNGNIGSN